MITIDRNNNNNNSDEYYKPNAKDFPFIWESKSGTIYVRRDENWDVHLPSFDLSRAITPSYIAWRTRRKSIVLRGDN